jgi:predicted PhzF superfamily epimerase YddE/YHI9
MPEPIRVDVVRVFSDDADTAGTRLGVVVASEETDGRESAMVAASELGAAVFVGDVVEGVATIRIFTSAAELTFAGVAAVGAAWWFAHVGAPVRAIRLPVGEIVVHLEGAMTWVTAHALWLPELVAPSGTAMEPQDELIDLGGRVEFDRSLAV